MLNGMTEAAATKVLGTLGARPEEARRIYAALLRERADLEGLLHLPQVRRRVLERARAALRVGRLHVLARHRAAEDGFVKYVFALPDGHRVEAVRIPLFETHYTVCVSTQVGCPLACTFCATGRMGLARNLGAWEIVEQLAIVRAEADRPVRGVVFMGMGEPLLNYDAVITAARIFSSPSAFAIGSKRITVSTAGVVPAIRRYTAEGHRFRLAVSLTSAIPEKRAAVMPITRGYGLTELMAAVRAHALARRQRAMLAYVMIRGFNTGREDARALRDLVGDTPVLIDLIDVNDATGRYQPPTPAELEAFRDHLQMLGAPVVRRYSGGKSVEAACGMLVARDDGGAAPRAGVQSNRSLATAQILKQ